MNEREFTPPTLNLSRHNGQSPMRISMDNFFDLCFWIAEELQDLEARFDPNRNTAGFDCDIPFPDDLTTTDWY